jgi:membrane-associated phospholipid phosphatase
MSLSRKDPSIQKSYRQGPGVSLCQGECPLGGGTWVWQRLFPSPGKVLGWIGIWAAVETLAFLLVRPLDPLWEKALTAQAQNPFWRSVAEGISVWGDFIPGTLSIALCLWVLAYLLDRQVWRRSAYALLLAAALAGLCADSLRLVLGRPRPDATVEACQRELGRVPDPWMVFSPVASPGHLKDGLYGWQTRDLFHSLPSGHAASALATATVLSVEFPFLSPLWTLAAGSVLWSRTVLDRHHLSDVVVGGLMGLAFALRLRPKGARRGELERV